MTVWTFVPSAFALIGFAINEHRVWRRNRNSSWDLAEGQKKPPPPSSEGCEYGGTKLP